MPTNETIRYSGVEEYLWLEKLFHDDCRCESPHSAPGNQVCTGPATHRSMAECSGRVLNVCEAAARRNKRIMGMGILCAGCKSLARDCWTVIPI